MGEPIKRWAPVGRLVGGRSERLAIGSGITRFGRSPSVQGRQVGQCFQGVLAKTRDHGHERRGCGPVAHATITPSTALNRAGPEQRPGWSRAAPIPSSAGRRRPHPCAAAAALADAASAATGPHPGHPGEPPEHGVLLGHAAGPGGRADRSRGERHRPAAALRPGGGDLPAGGDRGARSGGAGAAVGGPAAAALRSAQPRCGGRDGRGQHGLR